MENKFTRLTLEQSDKKVVWEIPFEDVSAEDMFDALKTVMIGMTFHPDTFLHGMASYLSEWGSELYDVTEHSEEEYHEETDN